MKAQMFNERFWIRETDSSKLRYMFLKLLKKSGFKILGYKEHFFKPYGYSLIVLLSESHFAIHTFPEENKTYCELTSCVLDQFNNFLEHLNVEKV